MLAVVGLCVRMCLLLRQGRAEAAHLVERQQRMVVPLPARPGSIFARAHRSYVSLAVSRQVPGVYADPLLLGDEEVAGVSVRLGELLDMNPLDVQHQILLRRDRRFAWIKRQVSSDQAAAVRAERMPAVGVTHEWRREYPNGVLASSLIGFRLRYGSAGGGLELSQDKYLRAADGKNVILVDAMRRPIRPLLDHSRMPQDGHNVFLCLDAVIQGYLEQAVADSVDRFDARWGTGIVADPMTGEILAMCSVPTFDPNDFNHAPSDSRINRAVSMPYEPGSVAKPIFAAAAVNEGLLTYQSRIFCENGAYYARRGGRIGDHGSRYGWLSLVDVVVRSSNIGMAKVGEKLGNVRLHAVALRFGLSGKSGIGLPGESGGILRPLQKWDGYSLRRVPFGQEISTTALQLTMAFCSLANGGELLAPRLVDHVSDAEGRVVWSGRRTVVRRVLRPDVAARTLDVLRQVVERGTGKACRLSRWTSFGKTGTAQIAGRGGYVEGAYTGTFVGGAPANSPRLICLISIYWPDKSKGYYGGKVAAPYVKEVLQRSLTYLNVPSDLSAHAYRPGRRGEW